MTKLIVLAMVLLAAAAVAQVPGTPGTPPAASKAGAADMEPGVNTSSPSAAPQTPQTVPAAKPAAVKPAVAGTKPAATPSTTAGGAANKPGAADPTRKGNAKDRLDLESSQITGNRELPKVLYIVPWRSAELGDLVGRPVNSLLDEVLEPVDRDVFRRQNRYYEALQPNEASPPKQPEK